MSQSPVVPRIGVFGGTFDPLHCGHLHIAQEVRESLGLEKVVWIPAGSPPHKRGQIVSDDVDRLAMLKLALADSGFDEVSTIELERSGPSYTADTLELLHARLDPVILMFIMGEDSLRDFPSWRYPERILRAAPLAVAGRPGIDADLESLYLALPSLLGRLHIVPIEELAISSSDIRRRVAAEESISGMVPAPIEHYIQRHNLYGSRSSFPKL